MARSSAPYYLSAVRDPAIPERQCSHLETDEIIVKRMWMLAGLVTIAGAIGLLIAGGLSENMVFFLTPTELEARAASVYGEPLRLGGQVKPGSVDWDADSGRLRFVIADEGAEIRVECSGAPPAMFAEGIGVVVEGSYDEAGLFHGTNVMVKHSNEYEPPHDGVDPKNTYRSLIEREDG